MKEKGLTPFTLSKKCGIPHSTIYDIIYNKRNITLDKVFKLAKGLEVSIFDLIVNPLSSEIPQFVEIPVVGYIKAGEPIMTEQNIEGYVFFPKESVYFLLYHFSLIFLKLHQLLNRLYLYQSIFYLISLLPLPQFHNH